MEEQKLKINEVAKLTGITVRTLHYYDEIGLLKPSKINDSGYRFYDEAALETLQQILFFRELNFSLTEIKEIITNPNFNKYEALENQRALMIKKRNRIDSLIELLDYTLKGDNDMSFKQFDMSEIEKSKKEYAAEVRQRWGNTDAFKESEEKTKNYDEAKWQFITEEADSIISEFSNLIETSPESQTVQELVAKWQNYISENFYSCTNEILSGLALMYLHDERFKKNLDKHKEGTAEFISKAIIFYCDNCI